MTIGKILFMVAAILFGLGAIGSSLLANPVSWGFVCVALGLFLNGYDLSIKRR